VHPQMVRASRHFVERRLPWLRYTAEIFIGSRVRFTKSLFQAVFTSSCMMIATPIRFH
jgi:hypothetical protein